MTSEFFITGEDVFLDDGPSILGAEVDMVDAGRLGGTDKNWEIDYLQYM